MVRSATTGPIEDAIETERDAFPLGATVVAVSPLFRDGLRGKLADLRSRGHPVLAIYLGDLDLSETSLGYEVRSMGETFDLEVRAQRLLFQPPDRRNGAARLHTAEAAGGPDRGWPGAPREGTGADV